MTLQATYGGPTPELAVPPSPATDRWKAWDRFLDETPDTGFMQSSWWADFRSTVGFEHFAVILKAGKEIVGGAMVQKFSYDDQRCFYYIQDGPALPKDESIAGEVFEAILGDIEERRKSEQQMVSHLRIEPRWEHLPDFVRGFRTPLLSDNYNEPRNTLCIDLRPPEDAILAQMKSKGRYNIRVAQRHGVSVVEDPSEQGLADFMSIYQEMAAHQGIDSKPFEYFQDLGFILSSVHRGSVFFAEYNGIRIATALAVYFGRRATYFYGGSLHTHRNVMAPYLLHFEIMRKAKAIGMNWYDLWGIAPEGVQDHPWEDISVFKRKFGGVEIRLVPTLDYVYDPVAYNEYVTLCTANADEKG